MTIIKRITRRITRKPRVQYVGKHGISYARTGK